MSCNPTVQYNDFEGDGVETNYTITFPYINESDVQVRTGTYPNFTDVNETEYEIDASNSNVVIFDTAPTGPFRIYRCTYDQALEATFQAGSAIRAADLNDNFEQMLYIVQDANVRSLEAQQSADGSVGDSQLALEIANQALETAENAEGTADDAVEIAQNALDLVSEQVTGVVVETVGDLPAEPLQSAIYSILDSTGIEDLDPLDLLPDGFVGTSDVSVKVQWNVENDVGTWTFLQAYVIDPDARYIRTDWSIYPILPE